MELKIKLYGQVVARLDSAEDPMGWLLMQPHEVFEGWQQLSVREWSPERTDVAIRDWLAGVLPEGPSVNPFRTATGIRTRRWASGERQLRDALASVLWANADHDFAGAVTFEGYPNEQSTGYSNVTEEELGELVASEARMRDGRARPAWPPQDPWNKSALAGMRGKVTATPREDGAWLIARGAALDTWIVKHEDRVALPGEAGVEAIAQRALRYLDVEAAKTLSRVIRGQQCVLSERSDRYHEDGIVKARHQEDFLQASGWYSEKKHQTDERGEPMYPALYRLLAEHAHAGPEQCDRLTRVIAACVFAGNADMHRKNIGLLHARPGVDEGVVLAPVYDFATWPGLEQTVPGKHKAVPEIALGVNAVRNFGRIGPKQWIAVASDANVDADRTLEVVRWTGQALPEALAAARAEASAEDENREQGWVERRIEATIEGARARAGEFTTRLDALYRKTQRTRPDRGRPRKTRTGTCNPEDAAWPGDTEWMNETLREVWCKLGEMPDGLRLYGGGAFALYLGHRFTAGLDWATNEASVTGETVGALMKEKNLEGTLDERRGMIDCALAARHTVPMRFMECGEMIPAPTQEPRIGPMGTKVAAPVDLVASKLRCMERRTELQDYIDLAEAERAWPGIIRRAWKALDGVGSGEERGKHKVEPPQEIAAQLSSAQVEVLQRTTARARKHTTRGRG